MLHFSKIAAPRWLRLSSVLASCVVVANASVIIAAVFAQVRP